MIEHRVLVVADPLTPRHMARLAEVVAGWGTIHQLPQGAPPDALRAAVAGAEVVIGWPGADVLVTSDVRLLLLLSVGYDNYVGRGLETKPGFRLCNAAGTMSTAVAEHGVALMLALARNLPGHLQSQRSQRWSGPLGTYRTITGASACVIGLGNIGREVVRRCVGLGMDVSVVTQHDANLPSGVSRSFSRADVATAVAGAHHVFCTVAASPGEPPLVSREVLSAMPDGAYFYGLSRGSVVDEHALVELLLAGHLGGAGLDVFDTEPLPPASSLWSMPNVIVTPHVAGRSEREFDLHCDLVASNLERYRAGLPLLHEVGAFAG